MPKLILFDIDGTLVLTGGAGVRAMNQAFEETFSIPNAFAGVPMPGRTDRLILRDALGLHNVDADAERLDQFRQRYCVSLSREIVVGGPRKGVMPGVRELLEALSAREGVHLALLTGNFAEAARIKLEHFDLWRYFICGAFGDDAVDRNDLVSIALDRAQAGGTPAVAASDIFVVGDTPLDVACAHAAGARAIAVATGSYDIAALEACAPEFLFRDFRETARFMALLDGSAGGHG